MVIRPLRIEFNTRVLIPTFESLANKESCVVMFKQRRIEIKHHHHKRPRGFGIPFGGYFWLPIALFIAIRNKQASIFLSAYHLFLSIVPPIFGIFFLKEMMHYFLSHHGQLHLLMLKLKQEPLDLLLLS